MLICLCAFGLRSERGTLVRIAWADHVRKEWTVVRKTKRNRKGDRNDRYDLCDDIIKQRVRSFVSAVLHWINRKQVFPLEIFIYSSKPFFQPPVFRQPLSIRKRRQRSSGIKNERISVKKYRRVCCSVWDFKPYFFDLTARLFLIATTAKDKIRIAQGTFSPIFGLFARKKWLLPRQRVCDSQWSMV